MVEVFAQVSMAWGEGELQKCVRVRLEEWEIILGKRV
jgi:hypothetical protein